MAAADSNPCCTVVSTSESDLTYLHGRSIATLQLIGADVVLFVVGFTWGFGIGFGIAAVGTLLGEIIAF
jgi:hypothetical protein